MSHVTHKWVMSHTNESFMSHPYSHSIWSRLADECPPRRICAHSYMTYSFICDVMHSHFDRNLPIIVQRECAWSMHMWRDSFAFDRDLPVIIQRKTTHVHAFVCNIIHAHVTCLIRHMANSYAMWFIPKPILVERKWTTCTHSYVTWSMPMCHDAFAFDKNLPIRRGGGLGSRPKKWYGERLGNGVEYHLMKPTPRR